MPDPAAMRTEWAERQVEEFLSLPLIAEFVFRSLKHNDPSEKEVIDFLILHQGQSILISQKAQDDPTKRTIERNALWVLKNIRDALKPICGAIRTPEERPKWCEHPRRGTVNFPALPHIVHGVDLIETRQPVDVSSAAPKLPLEYYHVPISYFSINDFLNLVMRLRTVPELLEYLSARRRLPIPDLYIVGDERPLFEYYLLSRGTFQGCTGRKDVDRAITTHADLVKTAIARNDEDLFYSSLVEHIADALATRDPNYAQGMSEEMAALFDPPDERKCYLLLQEILTDMRLRERAALGRAFHETTERTAQQTSDLCYRSVIIDGRDRVFLFISTKGQEKAEIFDAVARLTGAALAHYQRADCLTIIDRDGEHYDLALSRPGYAPTPEDIAAGKNYFAQLKITSIDVTGV